VAVTHGWSGDRGLPHLAVRPGTRAVYAHVVREGMGWSGQRAEGWFPISSRLAPGVTALSVWSGSSIGAIGTTDGFYWTVDPYEPSEPDITMAERWPIGPSGPVTFELETGWRGWSRATSFLCGLDGVLEPCPSVVAFSGPLSGGEHVFTAVGVDDDGDESLPSRVRFTVDATPPAAPVLDTSPPSVTKATAATFEFHADEPGGALCALDGAEPAACESPVVYEDLDDGAHSFSVRALDVARNASAPTSHAWTVDTTPPGVPSLVTAPPAVAGAATAAFTFTAPGATSTTCALDGATPVACASGVTYASLAEGPHTVAVRALDDLGNASDPATHSWTVDLTPPAGPVLTSAPPALTASTQASFAWQADPDVEHYACSLDGEATICTGSYYVGHGPHEFALRAYDAAGHTTTTTHAWTVDAVAPVATIGTPPASLTPTVSVTLDEPGTVALALRTGTTNVPATTTATTLTPVSPLVPGQVYTVTATATDALGNVAPPVERTFRAPGSQQENSVAARPSWRRARWTGAQDGWFSTSHVRGASATFAFTGTSVVWYTVRGPSYGLADVYVDDVLKASRVNLYAPTLSAYTRSFSGLTNAPHTIRVVARGERGSASASGSEVAVDAFRVGRVMYASPVATWTWSRPGSSTASGGAYAVDDAAGASFAMTFRGRGIDWITALGPNMGLARVTIDGVSKGTFDGYASTARWGVRRSFGGLSDVVHTITETELGQRRAGATGSLVAVDRLDARP
jgi:hypothetical protein